MRPLSLRVKGFTSFRDEQVIDFSDLDLFVLWGPTGSGKSSLLDAMTYALYGYVDRVGNQTTQLVSQGQPRMAVTLDFALGQASYRVTRSTSAAGGSKVLLERQEGGDWVSYGEGADSVREVNRLMPELVGLDYDAFTRSIVLPQGKFAEFLSGDAPKRREILTELLGLELFKRMGNRAREIERDARSRVETRTDLIATEYEGVDQAALNQAVTHHRDALELQAAAEKTEASLIELEKAHIEQSRSIEALQSCLREARALSDAFGGAAVELEEHAGRLAESRDRLSEAMAAMKAAEGAHAKAGRARRRAEQAWGSLEDMVDLQARVRSLDSVRAEVDTARGSLAASEAERETAAAALEAARAALEPAVAARKAAAEDLQAARAEHDAAHRSDLVGTLVSGISPGDPCPVCERPLDRVPASDRAGLEAATRRLASAQAALEAAEGAVAATKQEVALAEQGLGNTDQATTACRKELDTRLGKLEALEHEVAEALGDGTEPGAELASRMGSLRKLIEEERAAEGAVQEARSEVGRRQVEAERAAGGLAAITERLAAAPLPALIDRARAAGEVELPDPLPPSLPPDPQELSSLAAATAKALAKLSDDLAAREAAGRRALDGLTEKARRLAAHAPAPGTAGLGELVSWARATCKELAAAAVTAGERAQGLERRLEARRRLEGEIERDRARQTLYAALGKELKSDRIVQFLQAEALVALAGAASHHLLDLSGSRYRLAYEGDSFFAVDAWNGDERRNVKTLSGGETFLASLALALALSEQVQLLAVTERNRLESLFLDEGFGTLDAETLEAVVTGIEQLGRDGRLVGVITHVPELAERVPIRFRVTKSPRGSTVCREDPEPAL